MQAFQIIPNRLEHNSFAPYCSDFHHNKGLRDDMFQAMYKFFNDKTPEEKICIANCCRWYSYHFDTYINSNYRKSDFPNSILTQHFKKNHPSNWTDSHSDEGFKYQDCKTENPFSTQIINENQYSEQINNINRRMNEVFCNEQYSFVTTSEITMYRGLRLPIHADINFTFNGITSMSSNPDSAIQFSFSIYGEDRCFDERIDKAVLIEILLPVGTRIIPMNIRTIQNEDEFILLNQGVLTNIVEEPTRKIKYWNKSINSSGYYCNNWFIPLLTYTCKFEKDQEFPTYNNEYEFKV